MPRPAAVLLAPLLLSACGGARGAAPSCAAPAPGPPRALAAPVRHPDDAGLPPETFVEPARAWKVVAIHHSAGPAGGAARFDEWHRAKGWDGVGYDFVVGNGTDTPDGAIEVTFRWREQRDGAHVKGWNDLAVGICLVGDFEETDPTSAQVESTVRLLRHLRRRFGIPVERVVGHGALGATLCPGKRLDVRDLARRSEPGPAAKAAVP